MILASVYCSCTDTTVVRTGSTIDTSHHSSEMTHTCYGIGNPDPGYSSPSDYSVRVKLGIHTQDDTDSDDTISIFTIIHAAAGYSLCIMITAFSWGWPQCIFTLGNDPRPVLSYMLLI